MTHAVKTGMTNGIPPARQHELASKTKDAAPPAPTADDNSTSVTVQANDTLSSIARAKGISLAALVKANTQIEDINLIRPGQKLNLPSPTPKAEDTRRFVQVKSGENLTEIASRHGVSVQSMMRQNPQIRDANRIHAGQHLELPANALAKHPVAPPPPVPTEQTRARAAAQEKALAARIPGLEKTKAIEPKAAPVTTEAPPKSLETVTHTPVGDLPYTVSDVSLARRAGYHGKDAAKAVFREVHVENKDGKTETRRLLPFRNAQNVWADEKGSELFLSKPEMKQGADGKTREVYRIENEQPNAAADAQVQATRLPADSMIVPSLGKDARDRIAELESKGFEVTGVLGTGFIDSKGKNIVGYHYANEARLRGEQAPASAGTRVDGLGSGKIHAGYRVTSDGKMHLLDFAGKNRNQIRQELNKLEADPKTAAINLFAHTAAQKPEDLVGVIGADNKPTALGKSRSAMVFDDKGEFVGHIQTPAVSLLDSVTLAKEVYGDKASRVLNQDGDFYAQSWFKDGRAGSSDRALHYDNAMLVVRRRSPGEKSSRSQGSPNPFDHLNRAAADAQYWVEENVIDNIKDSAQAGQQKLNELGDWLKGRFGQ